MRSQRRMPAGKSAALSQYLNPAWRPTVQMQLIHPGLGKCQLPTSCAAQMPPSSAMEKVCSNSEYRVRERQLEHLPTYTLLRSHLGTGLQRWAHLPLSLGTLKASPHELQEKGCRKGLQVNICHMERKASVQVGSL